MAVPFRRVPAQFVRRFVQKLRVRQGSTHHAEEGTLYPNGLRNVPPPCSVGLATVPATPAAPHVPWSYRAVHPPSSKFASTALTIITTAMWYWIMWHVYYEPDHIYGHYPYPDPSKWTDAELGIPRDDADD